MKILIADDELMVHEILKACCEELKYEAVCAENGQDAWEKIKEDGAIRLCIIDWMMPGIDGAELCRMIRNHCYDRYQYVILLTSKGASADIVKGLEAGADDYVVKPFNYEELKKRILIGQRIIDLEDRLLCAQEDLKKKNQKLIELNELKSDFVSIVSHELRTPLTSIKNAVSIVRGGKAGHTTEDQQKFLLMAERNIKRLTTIINDLLDLSKLEAGKMRMSFQKTDLSDCLDIALSFLKTKLTDKSIIFEKEIPANLPPLYIDPDRIVQVITNLIENAIKFVPKSGQISITANPLEGKFILISVSDTGIGIPPEELDSIFDKFHQVAKPLTRKVGGTGLGLSIVKKIIEEHQGKIRVESEMGKGSSFYFTLPQWRGKERDGFHSTALTGLKGEMR